MSASKEEAGNKHGVITAYPNYAPSKQEQSLPGSEAKMDPLAEHLLVEKWDDEGKPYLTEYVGSGKLQGKTAIITGGDSGIGRSVALMYALEGCKLTIAHLPEEQEDGEKVVKMVKESKAAGACKEIQSVPGDLRDESYCKHLVETHMKTYGKLDIVVNNASKQIPYKRFEEIDLDNVESTFRSNILGAMAVTKYSLNHLKRGGCIVISGSVTAFRGSANKIDYSSTKGALHSFTRSLAAQLAPRGIRVNSVAPGPVSAEEMEEWAIGGAPLHGRPAQPAEMGASYVFLADSGSSNIMTGQTLHLNGGSWMGS